MAALAVGSQRTILVCLIGRTGSGKSTLGNVLLGKKVHDEGGTISRGACDDNDGHQVQHHAGFRVGAEVKLCTRETEKLSGHWFGDPKNPTIDVIDTPGHGGGEEQDEAYRQSMVGFIKNLGKVDLIIYVKNALEPRFDAHDVESFRVFSEMFGAQQFFRNLVVVISHWSFAQECEKRRKKGGATLDKLKTNLRAMMESKYPGLCGNIPIIALDALIYADDEADQQQDEKEHFWATSAELLQAAMTLAETPLLVQDVRMVEDEDKKMMRNIESLRQQKEETEKEHQRDMENKGRELLELQKKNADLLAAAASDPSMRESSVMNGGSSLPMVSDKASHEDAPCPASWQQHPRGDQAVENPSLGNGDDYWKNFFET